MARPKKTLLSTITDMAIKTFYEGIEGPYDEEKELRWFGHWFKTAETFCEGLENEGLTDTVAAVKQIILDQKKIIARFTN